MLVCACELRAMVLKAQCQVFCVCTLVYNFPDSIRLLGSNGDFLCETVNAMVKLPNEIHVLSVFYFTT